jgi:nitrate/TMAO reductase-like tetraheme cytochrome c subunit
MRILFAGVIVVGLAVGLIAMSGGSTKGEPAATASTEVRFKSSAECAECHSEIAREVAESWHGLAYKDEDVLKLSNNFSDPQCIPCHAPVPIFEVGPGERVFARRENREAGIDCISCHLRPDGTVAGKRGLSPDAPCRPVVEKVLSAAQFCAGCHNQHWTVDEWAGSKWFGRSSCNDCHMPKVDRPVADGGPIREGVSTHLFEGGHYLWMLKKAASLGAEVEDGVLRVRVTNSGAGHKMPTDARHRSFNLLVTTYDEEGAIIDDQKEIAEYRLYYRQDHIPSTQIAPFETRTEEYRLPATAKGKVLVEFVYCLRPTDVDTKGWTVVETLEVEF